MTRLPPPSATYPPSRDPFDRVTDLDASINSRQEVGGASLVANWDIGPATITSVSAWRYWDWQPQNDRDFTGCRSPPSRRTRRSRSRSRRSCASPRNAGGKLDTRSAPSSSTRRSNTQGSQVQGPAASRWLLTGRGPVGSSGCATPTANACNPAVLNGLTSTNTISFDNTSFAVFGKLNWEVAPGFHIQPGLRVNYDKKSGSYVSVVRTGSGSTTLNADQAATLAPQSYAPDFSDWNVSGDLTLSYEFSRDVHGYATYAKSFKSGGINLSGLPLNPAGTGVDLTTETVKPEKVNHFELGLKTQFLDRRLTFNLAGFWTEITDYQATVNNGQLTVIRGYLANAGKVRSRGVEFDSSFRPSDRFNLYVNGAYTDATYEKFANAPCPPELSGGTVTTGTRVRRASPAASARWSATFRAGAARHLQMGLLVGGEYNVPVGEGQVYLGYDGSYRSSFSSNPSPSAYTWIDGYALSNFRLGYRKAISTSSAGSATPSTRNISNCFRRNRAAPA
jgi:iron complex outermembrane receptor protein